MLAILKRVLSIFIFISFVNIADAQKTSQFSAQQAVDYAMKNATEIKNALLDIKIQKQSNKYRKMGSE